MENLQLEDDFLEYLASVDRSNGTITQYRANLHVFWCWNLENNNNKFFINVTKREAVKFQNNAINKWGWSPRRVRTFKATPRSLENYISDILDDEFPNYKKVWSRIESPADEAVRQKSIFTVEDVQNLLDELVKQNDYEKACLIALAAYSGRRKAELTRFKVDYFDDKNLICGGALYKTPEKMVTKGRGQRGKLLDVYILAKPFRPYFESWMQDRKSKGIQSEWLFPKYRDNQCGEHIDTTLIDSWFRTFSKMCNMTLYPHMFRHFFTSHLSEEGIPDDVIKDIVGWKDISLVSVYKDIDAEDNFEKYFGAEGIKKVERKSLTDL